MNIFVGDIINTFRDLENYFGDMDILTWRFFIVDLKICLKTWKIQCRHIDLTMEILVKYIKDIEKYYCYY
jgi:hypothetical protein